MLKLLIVDDEPMILNGLMHMIRNEHTAFTEIESAPDAIEALEKIDIFQPDLVITDIQMPVMDGLTFIREAQQRSITRFVVLSGYDHFDYARQAIRLNVKEYLLKPIQLRELSAVLKLMAIEVLNERQEQPKQKRDQTAEESLLSANIRKFKAYVSEHYMYDISLDDVAAHLKLHPNYVCNILKKETGYTFIAYLHNVRIHKAKELLAHSDGLTMERIAKTVGYDNLRHFYNVFKKLTGQTPGGYKQKEGD